MKKTQTPKVWSVYLIKNSDNVVEYVGCSANPKQRWYNHTYPFQHSGIGRFANRTDVRMEIVKEFDNRRDGWDYEAELKLQYGLPLTEEKCKNGLMQNISVVAFCAKTGETIGAYRSVMHAARSLGVGFRSISSNIKGRCKVVDRKYQFKSLENIN